MHDSDSTSSAHVSAWGPHTKPSQQTKHLRHGALAPSGAADNDAIHMNRTLSGRTTQTASQQTNKPFRTRWRGSHLYLPLSAPITTSGFCVGWRSFILCIYSGIILRFSEAFHFFLILEYLMTEFSFHHVWFQFATFQYQHKVLTITNLLLYLQNRNIMWCTLPRNLCYAVCLTGKSLKSEIVTPHVKPTQPFETFNPHRVNLTYKKILLNLCDPVTSAENQKQNIVSFAEKN